MCIPRRSKRLIVSRPCVPLHRRKIGRFCFKCPTNSLKIADVYPMSTRRNARGTRACGFFASLRRPPGGLPPFECQKAAKLLLHGRFAAFFLSRMLGIWYRRNGAFFGFFSSLHKAEGASLARGPRRNRRKRRCDSEKMEPESGNFRKESNTI